MKKYFLLFILIPALFLSCYIVENSSSESGSISFLIPEIMKAAAPETKLKIRFFEAGDMSVDQNPSGISYLTGYPSAVSVTGQSEFTYNSESSGFLTITGIPSGRQLEMLAEYYSDSWDWYMKYAGKSSSFILEEEENKQIVITMVPADDGVISISLGSLFEYSIYYELLNEEDFLSLVSINGSEITYDPSITVESAIYSGSFSDDSPRPEPYIIEAIIPGKKMRLLISQYSYPGTYDTIGISGTFTLLPGKTSSIAVSTSYEYAAPPYS